MDGKPQWHMPLHERWSVLIEFRRACRHRIFRIRALGKFAGVLEYSSLGMFFHHGLQEQIDNFRMEIAANQQLIRSSNQRYVAWWKIPFDAEHALWQRHSDEVRVN